MVEIVAISPDLLDEVWSEVEPFVQDALDRAGGEELTSDVFSAIKTGRYVLLAAVDKSICGIVTLEILTYPRRRKIGIVHAAGKDGLSYLPKFWEVIKQIAIEQQADAVTWQGRKGWDKVMKDHISKSYVVSEVSL